MPDHPTVPPTLYGYGPSVYTRVARMTLAEKGVAYDYVEVNPFHPQLDPGYLAVHPFRRVPALVDDGRVIFETAAVTQYVDEVFPGPSLQPDDPVRRARMRQVIGIVDAYAYWPLVRQVYVERVAMPALGRPSDESAVRQGLEAAGTVLRALEQLLRPPEASQRLSLADVHVAPMIACFAQAPEGADMLAASSPLQIWWQAITRRPSFMATEPGTG